MITHSEFGNAYLHVSPHQAIRQTLNIVSPN